MVSQCVGPPSGSVAEDGVSYTEKEYRYARELNKPRLVFVRGRGASITEDKLEQDDAKKKKLQLFIQELNTSRLAQRFDNHDQLGANVLHSLAELRKKRPSRGYIRASNVGPIPSSLKSQAMEDLQTKYNALLEERDELIRKNHNLESKLGESLTSGKGIGGLSEIPKLPPSIAAILSLWAKEPDQDAVFEGHDEVLVKMPQKADLTLGLLFVMSASLIMGTNQIFELQSVIMNHLGRHSQSSSNDKLPDFAAHLHIDPIHEEALANAFAKKSLESRLTERGLIETTNGGFFLTEFGYKQYALLRSVHSEAALVRS